MSARLHRTRRISASKSRQLAWAVMVMMMMMIAMADVMSMMVLLIKAVKFVCWLLNIPATC